MSRIAYLCNLNLRDKYFGYKPEDELVYVGEVEVETRPHSNGLDAAYRRFNRIDVPTPELDEAEAPSMSVGDVAHIRDTDEWFAVASVGFERIKQPKDEFVITNIGRKVSEVISKRVDQINREGR